MRHQDVVIPVGDAKRVSGILSVPDGFDGRRGVILAHGAGNDMHQPLIAFVAEGLARAGWLALRFNFLYRDEGRNGPDRPEVLEAVWESAWRFLQHQPGCGSMEIVAAGKSLGGRIASHLVAEGRLPASRLIFLGYPLHPAGKPERLRDAHLYNLSVPMLFLAGTRDPLCSLERLNAVLPRLKAPWRLEVIEGGDHSFHVPKSVGTDPVTVRGRILEGILDWLEVPV